MLTLIEEKIDWFKDMIDKYGNKDGTKWDDIIIRLEWQQDYESMVLNYIDYVTMIAILDKAKQSMKYCFSSEMVEAWAETNYEFDRNESNRPESELQKKTDRLYESFENFMLLNAQMLQKEKLARIDELIDSMID